MQSMCVCLLRLQTTCSAQGQLLHATAMTDAFAVELVLSLHHQLYRVEVISVETVAAAKNCKGEASQGLCPHPEVS